ncbi:MAG: DUF6732 family protein [Pseudomonadota bacterium]
MRFLLTLSMMLLSGLPAQAHVGHLAEVAGHGHWLGAAAIGAAIALGVWAGRKDKDADQPTGEEAADEELEEAAA